MKLLPTGKLWIITLFLMYNLLLILESKESFSQFHVKYCSVNVTLKWKRLWLKVPGSVTQPSTDGSSLPSASCRPGPSTALWSFRTQAVLQSSPHCCVSDLYNQEVYEVEALRRGSALTPGAHCLLSLLLLTYEVIKTMTINSFLTVFTGD